MGVADGAGAGLRLGAGAGDGVGRDRVVGVGLGAFANTTTVLAALGCGRSAAGPDAVTVGAAWALRWVDPPPTPDPGVGGCWDAAAVLTLLACEVGATAPPTSAGANEGRARPADGVEEEQAAHNTHSPTTARRRDRPTSCSDSGSGCCSCALGATRRVTPQLSARGRPATRSVVPPVSNAARVAPCPGRMVTTSSYRCHRSDGTGAGA
ncbi:MAG: hypothetical protein NVS3B26_22880 [Mycobacteriales bacterium]